MRHNLKPEDRLNALLDRVLHSGADAADAVLFRTAQTQASTRRLKPEAVERSESAALGLRAWVGDRQAVISSTDLSPDLFSDLAERVVHMARAAPPDPDATLADAAAQAADVPPLDLFDAQEPDTEWLMRQCAEAEDAALSTSGITNSEGADAAYGSSEITLVTRPARGKGFARSYRTSHCSVSVSVLAGEGERMERDYDYAAARHRADLPPPQTVGREAARRALARLNPRKMPTCQAPVVFDPRVARALLSYFAQAVNGASIARGTSFLKDALETPVFAPGIRIVDDPHRRRGLGSRPFDAEGLPGARMHLAEDGVLKSWLLDTRTANRLKLRSTGHATRGIASPPSPASTNLYLEAGAASPQALMAEIKSGFYVTETFGMGVNLVTGDYSQGAAGFWIENGALAYPVSEVTVAGHLRDMFASLTPANDLEFRYGTNAPTVRVARMTVAGT